MDNLEIYIDLKVVEAIEIASHCKGSFGPLFRYTPKSF